MLLILCMLWICFRFICICSVADSPTTVDVVFQDGVTITSAKVHHSDQPSNYFRYLYMHNKDSNLMKSDYFPEQLCSLEMMGISRFSKDINAIFPLRKDGMEMNGSVQATINVELIQGPLVSYRCFIQQFYNYKLNTSTSKMNMLAYFCPIKEEMACKQLSRRNTKYHQVLNTLNISLFTRVNKTIYPSGELISEKLSNFFLLKPLPSIIKNENTPTIGVCSTFCYGSKIKEQIHSTYSLGLDWLYHYTQLNMRIMLYDGSGWYVDSVNQYNSTYSSISSSFSNIHYHPYCMFELLQFRSSILQWDPALEGYKPNKMHNWNTDAEKIVTFTQCRMELSTIYELEQVLVIDMDEFIYCYDDTHKKSKKERIDSNIYQYIIHNNYTQVNGNTYETQKKQLKMLINKYNGKEISFPQILTYKRSGQGLFECQANAERNNQSKFSCLSTMLHTSLNAPKLKKNLHTNIMCPLTNYHNACLVLRMNKNYYCDCPIHYVANNVCAIIHYEKNKNRYLTNESLPENELVKLMEH